MYFVANKVFSFRTSFSVIEFLEIPSEAFGLRKRTFLIIKMKMNPKPVGSRFKINYGKKLFNCTMKILKMEQYIYEIELSFMPKQPNGSFFITYYDDMIPERSVSSQNGSLLRKFPVGFIIFSTTY